MRQRGVTEMSAAIKGCGWSRQCTLSASIYSGEELVALGYNAEVLKKKKADLLSDVKAGLVPKVGGDRPQEEKDLADPNKDVFALVFDGQHRYSQQSGRRIDVHHAEQSTHADCPAYVSAERRPSRSCPRSCVSWVRRRERSSCSMSRSCAAASTSISLPSSR